MPKRQHPEFNDLDVKERPLLEKHGLIVAEQILADAKQRVADRIMDNGRISAALLDEHQHAAHGLAWLATYVEALRQITNYSTAAQSNGAFGEVEQLLGAFGFSEYLAQIFGGIAMSQSEFVRLTDFGLQSSDYIDEKIDLLISSASDVQKKRRLVQLISESSFSSVLGNSGLDETLEAIRDEIRKFCDAEVTPFAHEWHLKNEYIPIAVIQKLSDLGVFGLTVPEEFGGMGLGKVAMCVVTEELSRAYIGVGSLGTRSEIAAELILCGGTEEQKAKYLPSISAGECLTTAVFTEPNTGSDLASLRTRAVREADVYKIQGNKTWITHAARADLMTVLARTDPNQSGYQGLSMFLVEKPRGSDSDPFPANGMSGTEIEVLGYRGMKEYEIAFEGMIVPANSLLGSQEGLGFKQLMQTFESARIQTAARAVGVAQSAFDAALRYSKDRIQFGKALIEFPRVIDKLANMAVEIHMARQITYFSAREKDEGKRCDLEAGMAKLLGARVAWAAADNSLQIHGGNGFALEYPISRILCDARILNIFEGAAEIRAQVICRRLLEDFQRTNH